MEQAINDRSDVELLYTVSFQKENNNIFSNEIIWTQDTDSIFYSYKEELGDPIPSGEHFGELVDECPDGCITEYVSGKFVQCLFMC